MTDKPDRIDIAELLLEAVEAFEEEFPGLELLPVIGLLDYWAERCGDYDSAASQINPADLLPGAVHGAGHAVVACLLDVPVKYVTLHPAQCRIEHPPDEAAELPRWIVQCLAAQEAEKVILDLDDPGAHETDESNARILLDRMTAATGRRHTAEPFRQRARFLVIEHRSTVEAVARILMLAGIVSGGRIAAIVKGGSQGGVGGMHPETKR